MRSLPRLSLIVLPILVAAACADVPTEPVAGSPSFALTGVPPSSCISSAAALEAGTHALTVGPLMAGNDIVRQRDRDGLEEKSHDSAVKLSEAQAKLDAGDAAGAERKVNDAATKLSDYQRKLDQLAATIGTGKDKITASAEAGLQSLLDVAVTCVSGLTQ